MEVLDRPTWNFAMKTELEVKETHMENILTVAEASTKSHVFVNGWLRPISRGKNHDIGKKSMLKKHVMAILISRKAKFKN